VSATLLLIAGAYLIGSVSFAVVVSRVFGLPDPHEYGSGNPGATNVLRTGHRGAALLTLLGDGAKGFVAVFAARHLAPLLGQHVDHSSINTQCHAELRSIRQVDELATLRGRPTR